MIERTVQEGILTLRLAHGKASALDVELLDALLRELEGVSTDVRAIILTGTGSIFSAGVDLIRLTQEARGLRPALSASAVARPPHALRLPQTSHRCGQRTCHCRRVHHVACLRCSAHGRGKGEKSGYLSCW